LPYPLAALFEALQQSSIFAEFLPGDVPMLPKRFKKYGAQPLLTSRNHQERSLVPKTTILRVLAPFFALMLFIVGLVPSIAVAQTPPPPSFAICSNPSTMQKAAVPGPSQLLPGRYFNFRRGGQGWDFFWYGNLDESSSAQADRLFVAFYTYEWKASTASWVPVWYGATYDPTASADPNYDGFTYNSSTPSSRISWTGILHRYNQVDFAQGGFGPIREVAPGGVLPGGGTQTATRVGTVKLFFGSDGVNAGQRPDQAAVSWQLDASANGTSNGTPPRVDECLTNFLAAGQTLAEDGRTGVWAHSHSAAGWFWSPVYWSTPAGGTAVFEHHLLSFFDADRRPSWVVAGDNTHVCFSGPAPAPGITPPPYPTQAGDGTKAICAMRPKGYRPWDQVCVESGSVPGCIPWTTNNYMVRVGKMARRDVAPVQGINRGTLSFVREMGVPRALGNPLGLDTSPLSVAAGVGSTNNQALDLFTDVVEVSQLNGLTRMRVNDEVLNGDDASACYVVAYAQNGQSGLCNLRVHFMTEGAHPGLTIVRKRLASGGAPADYSIVKTGLMRSPVGGLPFPALSTAPTDSESLIIGDAFQFEAYANASALSQQPLPSPLFRTSAMSALKRDSQVCSGDEFDTTNPVSVTALAATAAGQPIRVIWPMVTTRRVLGVRLRFYDNGLTKLFTERLIPLNLVTGNFDQQFTVTGLAPGTDYKVRADIFNHCSKKSSSLISLTAQDYETPDDPFTLINPTQTSDGSNTVPMAGSVPMQVEASGGSSAVTIPIEVAPGRHGMQPSLSLNYSSRGGNGLAGMGWGLSGTSSIHRCPRTSDQDANQPGGVEFSLNDRLCLDGQRLVAVAGAYGTINAEYRTEVDQFLRVRQLGGDLTGVATKFTVEYSNGQSAVYGDSNVSANSRVTLAVNGITGNQTLSWQLSRRQDGAGNTVTYTTKSNSLVAAHLRSAAVNRWSRVSNTQASWIARVQQPTLALAVSSFAMKIALAPCRRR
jgi:hypothetical protein